MSALQLQALVPGYLLPTKELMTLDDTARFLGVSRKRLTEWRLAGRGPRWHKDGRRIVFPGIDLAVWALNNGYIGGETRRTKVSEAAVVFAQSFAANGLVITVIYREFLPDPSVTKPLRSKTCQTGEWLTEERAVTTLSILRRKFMRSVYGATCDDDNRCPLSSFFVIENGAEHRVHHHGKMECPPGMPIAVMEQRLQTLAKGLSWIRRLHFGYKAQEAWDRYGLKRDGDISGPCKIDTKNSRRRT